MEDLTDIVHGALDAPDPPRGGGVRGIYLHGFGLRGLLDPRIRICLWELRPSGLLVIGTQGGLHGFGS
jgi:hypothetical protein